MSHGTDAKCKIRSSRPADVLREFAEPQKREVGRERNTARLDGQALFCSDSFCFALSRENSSPEHISGGEDAA